MLAGDFCRHRSSRRVFKGEQMIATPNAGLDMATLGNHEFDFASMCSCSGWPARWWVIRNVVDTATGKIWGAAPYVVRTFDR